MTTGTLDPTPSRRLPQPGPAQPSGGAAAAYEFVLAPVLLALFGLWLDRSVFDTTPVITVVAAVVGLVGATARIYYDYKARMAALSTRPGSSPPAGEARR